MVSLHRVHALIHRGNSSGELVTVQRIARVVSLSTPPFRLPDTLARLFGLAFSFFALQPQRSPRRGSGNSYVRKVFCLAAGFTIRGSGVRVSLGHHKLPIKKGF